MPEAKVIVDPLSWLEIVVPDFASDEEALDRSRRESDGQITRVRMAPDYGLSLPLWAEDGGASRIVEHHLSAEIKRTLMVWQENWEASFIFPTGWLSSDLRDEWLAEGERLFKRVNEALWSNFETIPAFRRVV